MARLYADEHFPARVVDGLRLLGHDMLTVKQTNVSKTGDSMSDEQVVLYATGHHRAVVTQNTSDFRRMHREHPGHKGIIACPHDRQSSSKHQARQIDEAIKEALRAHGTLNGLFIWVDTKRR